MNLFNKVRVLCCASFMLAGTIVAFAGQYTFGGDSPLAQGRWVKIEVREAGIYELSDTQLREMGLNPATVSLFGHGGMSTPYNLVSAGKNNVEDNLVQIPVYRLGNKIYFYGRGLSNPKIGGNGYEFDEQNTFTSNGHYFLTDGARTLGMTTDAGADELKTNAMDCSMGVDYRIHHEDHLQGRERAGLLYWDYEMSEGTARSWYVPVEYPQPEGRTTLTVGATMFGSGSGAYANLSLYIDGTRYQVRYEQPMGSNSNGLEIRKSVSKALTGSGSSIDVGVTLDSSNGDVFFDWWMLNYPKRISVTDNDMVQQRLGVPAPGSESKNGYVCINDAWIAMDVTDPDAPVLLDRENGKAYFTASDTGHDLIVFNPAKTQMMPQNPASVPNQNLHASPDCSFLIVSVPEYREYAEEIARLHRLHDGINVLVATTDQIYNEFTGGNPHPMAYRMLVKMLYERKGEPLRNVLFLGPIRSDARNINNLPNMHKNFILGMQEGGAPGERVPALTMGFYGNTDDNLLPTAQDYAAMQVGVGLLPVKDNEDCKLAVNKIERYLNELRHGDMAWMVNEVLSMSCSGDQHMHDSQALSFKTNMQSSAGKTGAGLLRNTVLMPDFYTSQTAADLFTANLNQGKLISLYIGHAAATGLGGYVHTGDFIGLRNRIPSFMIFAGCDLMLPDHGDTGIVLESVLHAPRGLIGAIGSTRMAWANQNFNLASAFANGLYNDRNGNPRTTATTIGEAYAVSISTNAVHGSNKLVYEYIGDPALTVPVPLRGIDTRFTGNLSSFRGGDVILVSGTVTQNSGDAPFNGTAVLKLCEPTQTRSHLNDPSYSVSFNDVFVTSVEAKVENGSFTARIPLTAECDRFVSTSGSVTNMNLFVSAYDPTQRLGASGHMMVPMATAGRTEQPGNDEVDINAPVVNADYDADSDILTLTVSDNVGFIPGIGNGAGTSLAIDNKPIVLASDYVGTGGVRNYTASIYVGDYPAGKHTATYNGVDIMGNDTAESELDFTVQTHQADIILTMPRQYGIDSMEFDIDAKGRKGLVLVIFNTDGRRVYAQENVDGHVTWDCSDMKAGVYRAAVRAIDGRKCRSQWVTFSVMD